MATVKENLIAARALIDTPEKWLKGNLQNANGTCYCVFGAASAVARRKWRGQSSEKQHELCEALSLALPPDFTPDPRGILHIAQFNDAPTTTHADIMALFDRAISAQEPQP